MTNVTKLAVQGEEKTSNYVTAYEVDYSQNGVNFINIKNGLKPKVLTTTRLPDRLICIEYFLYKTSAPYMWHKHVVTIKFGFIQYILL